MARRRRKKGSGKRRQQQAPGSDRPRPSARGPGDPPAKRLQIGWAAALVANVLVLLCLAYAASLESTSFDTYYRFVQEDEWVEWTSFWSFMTAMVVFVWAAARQWRQAHKFPWFLAGAAALCLFVALEEISWGQRLLGYRPPEYFLEHNYQQELNIHNVISTKYRKLALKAVILGYGVVLPGVLLLPGLGRRLERWAVVGPPAVLMPSFLAAYMAYDSYPWKFTGEWVELMLGLGLLFSGLFAFRRFALHRKTGLLQAQPVVVVVASWLLVLALGVANAAWSSRERRAHPQALEAARRETEAVVQDFLVGQLEIRCGLHKRLYTYKEQYDQDYLERGTFAGLTAQGLPEGRAEFFLDPWNSPYWLRIKCSRDRSRMSAFVYSFGPNRRRESDPWEIGGDDVGTYIVQLEDGAAESGSG